MLRKLFFLTSFIFLLGLIGPVEAQDMEIGLAGQPPVLDGEVDDVWADASEQYFVPLEDPANGSGTWKVLYDSENLYVLVDMTDDILQNDSASSWQDDSVEIYFDGGNTKLDTPLSGDDHQYTFGWTTDEIQGTNISGYTEGIEHAQVDTDTGWRIEVKMPWMTIWGVMPQAGDMVGIDCYYNDDDDGGDSRENKMLSFSVVEGWNDASQWASAVLAGESAADTLSGLADVTVVDGAIESVRDGETEYVVADGDLILGTTTRWYVLDGVETLWAEGDPAPEATVSGTSNPKDGDVGSKADNFPVSVNNKFPDLIAPISCDFEGNDNSEIIGSSTNGDIYAIDGGSGKLVAGFPISIGDTITTTPSLFNYNGKINLVAANSSGLLQVWTIGNVENSFEWKEENADNENSSYIPAAENTKRINEFFPESRAYNYPNPVYEGTTNIRYYVAEDSKISIKIFDLAGDFVAELNDDAQGGMDNETVWNVGDIQSGVYFARIEANSTSGKTEQAVIKIAIVK